MSKIQIVLIAGAVGAIVGTLILARLAKTPLWKGIVVIGCSVATMPIPWILLPLNGTQSDDFIPYVGWALFLIAAVLIGLGLNLKLNQIAALVVGAFLGGGVGGFIAESILGRTGI